MFMKNQKWYEIDDPEEIDSPALLIFKDRVESNINAMIRMVGDPSRLVPHVKTHKTEEIVKMQLSAGIRKFKCATIAESEMLAHAGAKSILLAYQLVGPKVIRFLELMRKFSDIHFASLIDNVDSAAKLNSLVSKEEVTTDIYIDVDSGMHRTGISADQNLVDLYIQLQKFKNLKVKGLHIYDGHIHDEDYEVRKTLVESEFEKVNRAVAKITEIGFPTPKIIACGSPTFNIHALNKQVYCSPGTTLLWDYGYHSILAEQHFDFAAVLLTRVISKPAKGLITIDLGYKAVASENELAKRIFFLNLEDYTIHSQSEEHLVIEVKEWNSIQIGDILFGIPYHVCPTVALYDEAFVIANNQLISKWDITARRRKINI